MSNSVKKLTNKKRTNIERGGGSKQISRLFCCGKCNKPPFLLGRVRVRVSGVHKTCDPRGGAAGCAAGAVLSRGQIAYNETCEELHRRHAQGRVALAY